VIAGRIHHEQAQRVGLVALQAIGHPHVSTKNGLYTGTHRRFVKLDKTVKIADVGDRNSGHFELCHPSRETLYSNQTILQRILGMNA
jgi:hypothetical protein